MLLRRSPTALNEYVTPKRSNTDGAQLANDAIVGNYLSDHSRPHRSAMLFPTRTQVNGNDQLVARRFPGTGCHDGFVGLIARFVVPSTSNRRLRRSSLRTLSRFRNSSAKVRACRRRGGKI